MKITKLILSVLALAMLVSCEKDDLELKSSTSTASSSASHKIGQDCLSCHTSGPGEGVFTFAGSVYNKTLDAPYTNASIELRTAANGAGDLIASIEVDQKGNFYTTSTVAFGTGLYASIIGGTGTKYMSPKVTTGACNSCHGNTTGKLWAE